MFHVFMAVLIGLMPAGLHLNVNNTNYILYNVGGTTLTTYFDLIKML